MYKDAEDKKDCVYEEYQTPSTVMVPVFLDKEKYESLGGDRKKIHDALSEEIGQNMSTKQIVFHLGDGCT